MASISAAAAVAALRVFVLVGVVYAEISCPKGNHICDCDVDRFKNTLLLECHGKSLSAVPDLSAFAGLPISLLNLENNAISSLEEGIFQDLLFQGTTSSDDPIIEISDNPISTVEPTVFKDIKFATLGLRMNNCSLGRFPKEALDHIENITFLFMKDNKIEALPDKPFENQSKLRTIDLSGNPVRSIKANIFEGVEGTLKSVYLNNMGLVEFPQEALSKLKSLRTLELNDNRITQLGEFILKDFLTGDKLTLSLKKNRLSEIADDAFEDTEVRMLMFNVDNNRLTNLNWTDACSKVFNKRTTIDVTENPIHCDCVLHHFLETKPFKVIGHCMSEIDKDSQFNDLVLDANMANGDDNEKGYKTEGQKECDTFVVNVKECSYGNSIHKLSGTVIGLVVMNIVLFLNQAFR